MTAFFGELDMGPTVGGHDGFVMLRTSDHNRAALNNLRASNQAKAQ